MRNTVVTIRNVRGAERHENGGKLVENVHGQERERAYQTVMHLVSTNVFHGFVVLRGRSSTFPGSELERLYSQHRSGGVNRRNSPGTDFSDLFFMEKKTIK